MKLVNISKSVTAKMAAAVAVVMAAGAANAQTAGSNASKFEAIFTGAAGDFGTLIGYAITLAVVVWGGLVVFKLAKKLYNKAT